MTQKDIDLALKSLDVDRFWADDKLAHEENCFSKQAPQVALGIRMSDECVFAELGEPGQPWGHTPWDRRNELNRRYNDKAERMVGIRLLREDYRPPEEGFLPCRQIGEVFGGEYLFDGQTTWLKGHCTTPRELEAALDRVDRLDFEDFVLPNGWEERKRQVYEATGRRPSPFGGVRGPVTLACSLCGAENFIYMLYDEPELCARFRDTITRVILSYIRLFAREAGYPQGQLPRGFGFNDDDCCLLTPELYEQFGYPILKEVFDTVSPLPGGGRYQHSDSAMEHLLPVLGRLKLEGCNFGPTVSVRAIREYMPNTRIDGQLAPFTFMNNDTAAIFDEVARDCQMAREGDARGLNLTTAGSINNGSLLSSMRAVMAAIQMFGRY